MEKPHVPVDDEMNKDTVERPLPAHDAQGLLGTLRRRWPEYVIQICVIVLSISISCALDRWKERGRKRTRKRTKPDLE